MNGSNRFPAGLPYPSLMSYAAILPPPLLTAPKDFFVYGCEYLPLAISAVKQAASFQVQEDSAFLIVAAARLYLTNADAIIASDQALALVNVIDSGAGRSLISQTTAGNDSPIDNWFGTGKNPAYWPFPKILRPNSVVTVQLTNLEATARNYRLSFLGFKIFRTGANDPYSFAL
jgi:hypothetical protein